MPHHTVASCSHHRRHLRWCERLGNKMSYPVNDGLEPVVSMVGGTIKPP